ncbi:MAG: ABC transporter substrate-binding protein [Chloroflexaceae bacterium]|nr:ABC transporter substrate-binding protein [Chloroflexaceae bacterium]NJO04197.1 ABC transporter substrate-binding protein [Chloroflexaceae bacterium]
MKQMTRREFLSSVLAGSSVALLAACGAAPEAPAPAAEETAAPAATEAPAVVEQTGSTIEITYWGSFSDALGEAEQAMVESFNSSQSDVVVNYQFQGSYEDTAQKFAAALRADTIPDVVLLSDVWWFGFYLANAITPLDDLAAQAGVNFADYEPVLLNEGVRQGVHYWVPFARSTPLFYYNKQMWEEAGLPDRAPETWTEFAEWAPELMSGERLAFAHPNSASYVAWLFQGVVWQHGGQYSTPEFEMTMLDENTVRAGEFYRSTTSDEGWAMLSADLNQDFIGGAVASMLASTGGLAGIQSTTQFEVGVGFLPREASFGCPTGGAGMAIPADTADEKKLAAMQFIKFATDENGASVWSRSTGYMPVNLKAVESPDMQAFFEENPNFRTAVEQLPQTRAQDAARVFVPNGDQIIGRGLERILVNNEDVATVFGEVNTELEQAAEPVLRDLETREA